MSSLQPTTHELTTSLQAVPHSLSIQPLLASTKLPLKHQVVVATRHTLQVSLDVRGKQTLEESLDFYVQGELMEGDNQYLCEELGKKVSSQLCALLHSPCLDQRSAGALLLTPLWCHPISSSVPRSTSVPLQGY